MNDSPRAQPRDGEFKKRLTAGGKTHEASTCRCATAHRNEAVLCADVGDKLPSCELKWFKAPAKGDKSARLCSTNHCSRMVTLVQWRQGSPWPYATPSADHAVWPKVKHIGKKTVFFGQNKEKPPLFGPRCAACDSQGDRNTQKHKNFHIHQS